MKILKALGDRTSWAETPEGIKGYLTFTTDGEGVFTPVGTGQNWVVSTGFNPTPSTAGPAVFDGSIRALSQGKVVKVQAQPGQQVEVGGQLCTIEVMKMQIEVRAPVPLKILECKIQLNQFVAKHDLLFTAQLLGSK